MATLTQPRDEAAESAGRLAAAEAIVMEDPEVMAGQPCIVDTRIPVHLVAATFEARGFEETDACFPAVSREQIELAVIYANAHPSPPRKPIDWGKQKGPAVRMTIPRVKL